MPRHRDTLHDRPSPKRDLIDKINRYFGKVEPALVCSFDEYSSYLMITGPHGPIKVVPPDETQAMAEVQKIIRKFQHG